MRFLLFVLGVLLITATAGSRAEAQTKYPWCAIYTGEESQNCGFVSREQCMATVSGIGGYCAVNTQYQPMVPGSRPAHRY